MNHSILETRNPVSSSEAEPEPESSPTPERDIRPIAQSTPLPGPSNEHAQPCLPFQQPIESEESSTESDLDDEEVETTIIRNKEVMEDSDDDLTMTEDQLPELASANPTPDVNNDEEEIRPDQDTEPAGFKDSETLPNELFYPSRTDLEPSKLKMLLVNYNLTSNPDNILYFTSADSKFTSPTAKLMLDHRFVEKNEIKRLKPRLGELLVTHRKGTKELKTITAILIEHAIDEPSMEPLKLIATNLAKLIKRNNLKTLRIAKT